MIDVETLNDQQLDSIASRKHPFVFYDELKSINRKDWLVGELLGVGEASVIFGKPGDGKSVAAQDMAMHIAANKEWLGRAVKYGAVMYVALERKKLVERRALGFRVKHGLTGLPFAIIGGIHDLRDERNVKNLIEAAREVADQAGMELVLIVIDTLSRALCGGDENSPKDMGAIVNATSILQDGTGAHVLWIHHTPISGDDRMRGHGALLGAVDTTISVTNSGGYRSAVVCKANDSEEGASVAFSLESVVIDTAEDGTETTAPVVLAAEGRGSAARGKTARTMSKSARTALKALQEAIEASGIVPPASNHIPTDTRVVSVEEWRRYAYALGISAADSGERAKQMAFKRATEQLIGGESVGFWNDKVWIV